MREYELVLVFPVAFSEKDQKSFIDSLKKEIESLKGKVEKTVEWGKKEFAYPVKKEKLGFYHILELSLPEELPAKLDAKLRIDEKLLRYLLVRREIIKKAPKERKKKNGSKVTK